MNLTLAELIDIAEYVAHETLQCIDEHYVHETIEQRYGAVSDEQAREIADLAKHARIEI